MMKQKSKRRLAITAGELMDRLEADPEYQRRMAGKQREHQASVAELARKLEPVEASLRTVGYDLRLLAALKSTGKKYQPAIPILLDHLQQTSSPDVKDVLVGLLKVRWAKGDVAEVLLKEFENLPPDASQLRWSIGGAMTYIATLAVLENLIAIVTDASNGKAREMFVLALGKIRDPRSVQTLISLLKDEEVAGHAIVAIREIKAIEALDHLARFSDHPKAWVRNEAKKAIAALLKAQSGSAQ